ncbi:E3 ubiquitin-protein ligase Godzilla isoform X1 [Stomoxys calcitrans]|uniref:E3 ubiquitin-protein ligase Godzilla isoform X1 n=1 Tax=Stomoxys calcitrans TaxID=35570 RepID=UPI0027E35C84|nr:E3 ubiquitin-protein ligase Godzilla isoform X1 [Stomoxys calcitrans]XP_013109198.2 E3 ubiquitin-protein ligase Godzilla isoform X1 [Stomoxys calcitrans]XP_013109199.2 E3 ubiquitin-protein ligase Godzilla isoform X1 [Stomoxys calcitrans]XP_013109200.2 E3 ubiquitin-protein ligase Godzilla isoform X1 [Stomoxys calcitrans]
MEQKRCSFNLLLLTHLIVCLYILGLLPQVDGHILVYRRITNQVFLIEEYNDMPAQFGPSLSATGIKVFAIPAEPINACNKIAPPPRSNYPGTAKFAAIIQRGGEDCTFELKVRYAQAAHFDAAIIYNNEGDDLEHMSAQNSSGIMIPSVFVGHTTGMTLKSFYTPEIVLVINDELPFNINTQLILPFSILIGICFLIMIFYMIYKCIREERRLRRYRLPKRMLKKLPIIKYTKNSNIAYDTCVICIETFAEGDKLRVLPCKHPYHSDCIDVWLTENKRECPICKRRVFTKGEARSQRNRQSSLDSMVDTDDDTAPLLQSSQNTSSATITSTRSSAPTTRHGTFQRGSGGVETGASAGGDVTSDDENMLSSPARRINPFDRTPNLPPHWEEQLNNGERRSSLWYWPVFRWISRRPTTISIAAPPYQEDILTDVIAAENPADAAAIASSTPTSILRATAQHSSNNVLNPNLSGSFKDDDEDDDAPLQCIYEPAAAVAAAVVSNSTPDQQSNTQPSQQMNIDSKNKVVAAVAAESDPVFLQTPTQGGLAVAALPVNTNDTLNTTNAKPTTTSEPNRFW